MAIELIDTLKPKNNGKFPVVEAVDVVMPDGTRLDEYEFNGGGVTPEQIEQAVDDYLTEHPVSGALPNVTVDDAGKILRVSAAGVWELELVADAEDGDF